MAEQLLVLRCQVGDEQAFEQIVAAYNSRLRYYLVKRAVISLYLRIGRKLPPFLRRAYYMYAGRCIARRYTPLPFAGNVVIVRSGSTSDDPSRGWGQYIIGQPKIVELGGTHDDLMQMPHARELAIQMQAHLDACRDHPPAD